ncbi:hypothetical protein Hypma_003826 [Hypsizygus marmoreus]|uniref:F-box domain-containing protein n=1 Tax=Hypsizygus marmoreus TaxID=39966 RepID=A0A369JZ10_HYPMA|nr:hypothetical protein Hypma_003826 [Hypsizygus marmoreus]
MISMNLTRELKESDWHRINYYGAKVRHLDLRCSEYPDRWIAMIHSEALKAITTSQFFQCFVPKLRSLKLPLDDDCVLTLIPYLQCVLSRTLATIHISESSRRLARGRETTLMPHLLRHCPNIEVFKVLGFVLMQIPLCIPSMSELMCNLNNIRELNLGTFSPTPEMVRHLGDLPSLRSWTSLRTCDGVYDLKLFTTTGNRFPALRIFGFVSSWTTATAVVDSMRCPFESLSIEASPPQATDADSVRAFDQLIASMTAHPTVKSLLNLEISAWSCRTDAEPDVVSSTYERLFSFTALRSLTVGVNFPHNLDDSWIMSAAMAWPHLPELSLPGDGPPRMTLAGLIPLVKQCPHLSVLGLPVRLDPFEIKLLSGTSNAKIQCLAVLNKSIASPIAVFRCLVAMFPMLRSIYAILPDRDPGYKQLLEMFEDTEGVVEVPYYGDDDPLI